MKAATLSSRPSFMLMKQTDIQSFYHLQMPRWLFFDKKYIPLSLESKVVYMFLLNRFQLSKLNNWINDNGEVFIIYTRQSLADEIQISYRRVIDSMKELTAMDLIWEKRCGRGDANQIYLAKAELTSDQTPEYSSVPFVAPAGSRPAEPARLDEETESQVSCANDGSESSRPAETALQEQPETHVKTCENSISRSAGSAHQDMQNPHTSYIDIKNTDLSDTDSQSARHARARQEPDRQTDFDIAELDEILENCELWTFRPETAKVFENAIERLFFSESYRIGNCILPQRKVRSQLHELDQIKLQTAEGKISRNIEKEIRNTTAYTMAVIFNSIWETESDIMNDPYLNSLRCTPAPGNTERWDC